MGGSLTLCTVYLLRTSGFEKRDDVTEGDWISYFCFCDKMRFGFVLSHLGSDLLGEWSFCGSFLHVENRVAV